MKKSYGNKALSFVNNLVPSTKKSSGAEKIKLKQKMQERKQQILEHVQFTWRKFSIPKNHYEVVYDILTELDFTDLERLAEGEIVMIEKQTSFPQRAEKCLRMMEGCMNRLFELDKIFHEFTENKIDTSDATTEASKRLGDLSKINLVLVETVISWNGYVNYLASHIGRDYVTISYISDMYPGKDILEVVNSFASEISGLNLFQRLSLMPNDIFFTGRYKNETTEYLGGEPSDGIDPEKSRMQFW